MGPINAILERIGVAPAERGLFGWAALCLFLLGAAAIALMNTAETLFLKRVGVTSQQEIERAVRENASKFGDGPIRARVVLTIDCLDMEHVVEGEIDLTGDAPV